MKLKNNKGRTLLALTIYIAIFTLLIGIITTVSTSFFEGISKISNTSVYISEYNKFIMFFSTDIKRYNSANITDTTINFENGPTYIYKDNNIYRDDFKVAENILKCTFISKNYNVNTITKNIINVNMQIGKDENKSITKNIDFTLRYW